MPWFNCHPTDDGKRRGRHRHQSHRAVVRSNSEHCDVQFAERVRIQLERIRGAVLGVCAANTAGADGGYPFAPSRPGNRTSAAEVAAVGCANGVAQAEHRSARPVRR